MSITTTSGKTVRFLGFTSAIRMGLLDALLGKNSGALTVNSTKKCYLGLSKIDPGTNSETYSEPTDENYKRIELANAGVSDFLERNKYGYKNPLLKEIKFNRSLSAWADEYPYFILVTTETTGTGTLLAWGEMDTPIKVEAENVVPLFQEQDFKLYWPTPNEAEALADGTDDTDE